MRICFSVIVVSCLLIFSCKKKEDQRGVPPIEAAADKDLNRTKTKTAVVFNTPQNKALYEHYLLLKAALVNTNAKQTKKEADKFSKLFVTDSLYARARQVAILIAAENDIKKQREFFVGLTDEVTSILKDDVKSGKLYQQFCPMAFEGKGGYWLSDSDQVRNPYFGDQMLKCGEVVKVLQ
ncbi:DUF3347 domain-containing protein [Aquimarina agarilytica]|uniref:DUF3347 domain-containing protein n=1 Tax=Aquimarina agarilytica TaxID=1087449 RepID=UPI000289140A|nr:DUF3347 domain-containing protein [Aquimarina agarilytica]